MKKQENSTFDEENYIHEGKKKNPFLLWIFIFVAFGIFALMGNFAHWMVQQMETKLELSPFQQVTNREISLFLWQNPEYMRVHAKSKAGYLPGFQSMGKFTLKLEAADAIVSAPPELIFHYHTWKRLVGDVAIARSISIDEFKDFLQDAQEWTPENWGNAPQEYIVMINQMHQKEEVDLKKLPREVKSAFTGWKNYSREGDLINQEHPKWQEMQEFIEQYPGYARNNWQNLYPNYLESLLNSHLDPLLVIPSQEIPPFLRVAYFNFKNAAL